MFEKGDRTNTAFPCEVIAEISGGSMAKLFLAKLQNTELLFVIKAADKHVFALKKEADILGQIYHPCIPEVFGCFEEKNICYYIMSYHRGINVEKYVKRKGTLEEWEVKSMILKLCQVSAYVHQKGIIHGDIKPSNLLYNPVDGKIILLDFGTAEYIDEERVCGKENNLFFHGTLGYAAPECWHREQYFPKQTTDIFALGALMFYLLEGKEPKEHYGKFILSDIQKKNRWQPVLDKCCALHVKNRYQSTAEVFEAVKKIPY